MHNTSHIYQKCFDQTAHSIGISWDDTESLELLRALIRWTMWHILATLNWFRAQSAIISTADHVEKTKISVLQRLVEDFHNNFHSERLKDRYARNICLEFVLYMEAFECMGDRQIENYVELREGNIEFCIHPFLGWAQDDISTHPSGSFVYVYNDRKRTINIYYGEIIRVASTKWVVITHEEAFLMVLSHELSHLFSSEVPSEKTLREWKNLYDLRGSILGDDMSSKDTLHLMVYRTGLEIEINTWGVAIPEHTAMN